jgi:hypothetical protein
MEQAKKTTVKKSIMVEHYSKKNIEILVRDTYNMNEYTTKVTMDGVYLQKLVQWITKRRF